MASRGRPKKTGEAGQASKDALIVDAALAPYKIKIGERSYDVIKGDDKFPETYHTKLVSALAYVARQKTTKNKVFSLQSYIDELKTNQQLIAAAVGDN